jgi:hypothetical protein
MPAYVIVGGFFLACGALVWSSLTDRRKRRRRMGRWGELARSHGGRYQPPRLLDSGVSAEFVVGLTVVTLDTVRRRDGRNHSTFTRVRARFAYAEGPVFGTKWTNDLLPRLGSGWHELTLENDAGGIALQCRDIAATRHAWTARARQLFQERTVVTSTDQEVRLERLGVLDVGAKLDAMLELAAELASFGARDVTSYARLPDMEMHPPTVDPPTPFRCVLPTKVGEIEFRARTGGGEPHLVIELHHERKLGAFEATLGDTSEQGIPAELRGAEFMPRFAKLVGAALTNATGDGEGALTLEWPTMPEEEAVTRGVELLISVVAPPASAGAFR